MDVKSAAVEGSGENEKNAFGKEQKLDPRYGGMNLAEWYPSQFSYVESRLVSNELGHLAEEISKQNVEGVNWFVLIIYSKMQEETEI